MFRQIGPLEILVVLIIVVLVFGVGRISKIAGELGSSVRAFREGLEGKDDKKTEEEEKKEQDNQRYGSYPVATLFCFGIIEMEIFNIGLPEAFLIAVLIFLLLGADGTVETARKIGRFLRRIAKSSLWADITHTRQEVQDLTRQIMREAALQEDMRELQEFNQHVQQGFNQVAGNISAPGNAAVQTPSRTAETLPQDNPPSDESQHLLDIRSTNG